MRFLIPYEAPIAHYKLDRTELLSPGGEPVVLRADRDDFPETWLDVLEVMD